MSIMKCNAVSFDATARTVTRSIVARSNFLTIDFRAGTIELL